MKAALLRATILVCAGCGRIAFAPIPALGDAGTTDVDGKPDTIVLCKTWGPFSAPVRLPGPINTPTDDWEPFLWSATEIYFEAFLGTSDLMHAIRSGADFAAGNVITELSTQTFYERAPVLTADGLQIVYFTNQNDAGDLWSATRASTAQPFGPASALANINSPAYDSHPWISADGLRLVFASEINGDSELFEATRQDDLQQFSAPAAIVELETTASEISPTLSADGLEIIFSSDRAGGAGLTDLYSARRSATDQAFSAPVRITELSTAFDDVGAQLVGDASTVYFNYDTNLLGGRNADIWTATRVCQ